MKAAFLARQEFQERVSGHSVVLLSDNVTVVAYVNKRLDRTIHQWAVSLGGPLGQIHTRQEGCDGRQSESSGSVQNGHCIRM